MTVYGDVTVTAYLYDAEGRDSEVELTDEILQSLGKERLLWIDVEGRDSGELRDLARKLNLEAASVRRLLRKNGSPLENYGSYAQFSVETAPATLVDEQRPEAASSRWGTRLDFIVSEDWLVTVHEHRVDFIASFRSQDAPETTIGALTTHDFAASLLDLHLETFFGEVARVESLVDRLDEQALTRPSSRTLLGRMVTIRRRVSRLRTVLSRQRSVFYGLSRPDLQPVTESGATPHFQVLTSRFERAIDEVEHTRDLVVGSFELFATRTAQQTNELVKVLTFLTAVVGVCAAVAGVFGMNFETGVFSSGDRGFYVTIGSLLLLVLGATAIARWKGWL